MIYDNATSLFFVLFTAIDILYYLTEEAVALLSDRILPFNLIIYTEAQFSQVCAVQLREVLTAFLVNAIIP